MITSHSLESPAELLNALQEQTGLPVEVLAVLVAERAAKPMSKIRFEVAMGDEQKFLTAISAVCTALAKRASC